MGTSSSAPVSLHHAGDGIHAVPSEKTHEVVFQREIGLRKTRVALAGAAAKLIVGYGGIHDARYR